MKRTPASDPVVRYGKVVPTRAHFNHEEIAQKQKYFRRRVGAGLAGLVVATGGVLGAGKVLNAQDKENPYFVDRDKVEVLDPQVRDAQYETLKVGPGDTLTGMAEEYIQAHGGNVGELLTSLTVQARAIDIAAERPMDSHIIQPGEEYFIPRG